jgi:internalin A
MCSAVTDLSPLVKIEKLEHVSLNGTNISDISVLSGLKNLKRLDINLCHNLTDISCLTDFNALEELDFKENKNINYSAIGELINLKKLSISLGDILFWKEQYNGKGLELPMLDKLGRLESLFLCNSAIVKIDFLKTLTPSIKTISLVCNKISDISSLSDKINLTELILSHNNITDLTPLANLQELRELSLEQNSIDTTSLEPLYGLKNIEKLDISKTNIYKKSETESIKHKMGLKEKLCEIKHSKRESNLEIIKAKLAAMQTHTDYDVLRHGYDDLMQYLSDCYD